MFSRLSVLRLAACSLLPPLLSSVGIGQSAPATDVNSDRTPTSSSYSVLVNFNVFNGDSPQTMSLVQATDGGLYGTTFYGGVRAEGNVFRVDPKGGLTNTYSFCVETGCPDGATTYGGVIQGTDGNFYGTTNAGGSMACSGGCGSVFKLTPDGTLTTLHSFDGTDAADVRGTLLEATDGNFYGTSIHGGAFNGGTVFKITPDGVFSTLYSFCKLSNCTDGDGPLGGVIQASDGNLYGTTLTGGIAGGGYGTVFKLTLAGVLTTLHVFGLSDGAIPYAGLIQGLDGKFYGTTSGGGKLHEGVVFSVTLGGVFKVLHSFCGNSAPCVDGNELFAGVIQGTDGNLYGTTFLGGIHNYGIVFALTPQGKLTVLHNFDGTDGANAYGTLVQNTNGQFYGTTNAGGTSTICQSGCGTLFRLSQGLSPFVTTQTTLGRAGSTVVILGTNLTGSTLVTFNGTATSFSVVAPSEILATVPTGATSGTFEVTTPGGVLKSNKIFTIVK